MVKTPKTPLINGIDHRNYNELTLEIIRQVDAYNMQGEGGCLIHKCMHVISSCHVSEVFRS